jgi:hypothetical protein
MAERYQPITQRGLQRMQMVEDRTLQALEDAEATQRGEVTQSTLEAYKRMFGDYPRGLGNAETIARMQDPANIGRDMAKKDIANKRFAQQRDRAFSEEWARSKRML